MWLVERGLDYGGTRGRGGDLNLKRLANRYSQSHHHICSQFGVSGDFVATLRRVEEDLLAAFASSSCRTRCRSFFCCWRLLCRVAGGEGLRVGGALALPWAVRRRVPGMGVRV